MSHSGGSLLIHWIVLRGLRASPPLFIFEYRKVYAAIGKKQPRAKETA